MNRLGQLILILGTLFAMAPAYAAETIVDREFGVEFEQTGNGKTMATPLNGTRNFFEYVTGQLPDNPGVIDALNRAAEEAKKQGKLVWKDGVANLSVLVKGDEKHKYYQLSFQKDGRVLVNEMQHAHLRRWFKHGPVEKVTVKRGVLASLATLATASALTTLSTTRNDAYAASVTDLMAKTPRMPRGSDTDTADLMTGKKAE